MFILGIITGFVLGRVVTTFAVRYKLGKGLIDLGNTIKGKE